MPRSGAAASRPCSEGDRSDSRPARLHLRLLAAVFPPTWRAPLLPNLRSRPAPSLADLRSSERDRKRVLAGTTYGRVSDVLHRMARCAKSGAPVEHAEPPVSW